MKRWLKQILAVMLVSTTLCCNVFAASFPDVDESADYAEAVGYISDIGIMVGDDLGNFNPNNPVTRAEMATIICRLLNITEDLQSGDYFDDVPASFWANKYITKTAEIGVVNGYGNRKFGPIDNVKYEQVVTMIVRASGWSDNADMEKLGGFPNAYLSIAEERGLLVDVRAETGDLLSRSDVARLLYNYYAPPFFR